MPVAVISGAIIYRDEEWRPGATNAENFLFQATVNIVKIYLLSRTLQYWSARATMTFGQKMRIFGSAATVAGLDWLWFLRMTHYQINEEEHSPTAIQFGLNQLFTTAANATASLHPVFFTRMLPVNTLVWAWYGRGPGESAENQLMNAAGAAAQFCLPALAIRHALCKGPMRDAMSYSQQMLVFGGAAAAALAPPAWALYCDLKAKGARREAAAAPAGGC